MCVYGVAKLENLCICDARRGVANLEICVCVCVCVWPSLRTSVCVMLAKERLHFKLTCFLHEKERERLQKIVIFMQGGFSFGLEFGS